MKQNVVVESRGKVSLMRAGVVALAGGLTTMAMAIPDVASITAGIEEATPVVDAAGGSMVTVFIGVMVLGIIIGMISRKGK